MLLRLRALLAPRRVERELDDELAFHIEREAHEHMAQGMNREDAQLLARARFGSVPLAADQCRDARGTVIVDTLLRDFGYAVRTFRRAPLTGLTIVATIALGLALITVAFTIYNALFLRVDAVRHPEELFTVERLTRPDLPHPPGGNRAWTPFTRYEFELLRHDTGVLKDAVAILPDVATRVDGLAMDTTLVSGNFFQMLGVTAVFGRALIPADDDPAVGHQVLVLSHKGWNRLFAGDRTAVGRRVRVNGLPYDVVGVMPDDFRGLSVAAPDFWVPLALAEQLAPGAGKDGNPIVRDVVGRLPPGMSPEKAEAGLTAWASGRPDLKRNMPGRPNQISLTPNRGTLWALSFRGLIAPIFFAFALVLIIGCANVANLLLARGVSRQREIGIRLSLGAPRQRVIRQLFTESLLLSLVAAACGVILSRWLLTGALHAASVAMPAEMAERISIAPLPIDWRVVLFLGAVAVASTVLFGLMPALRATRVELVRAMKGEETRRARPGRWRQTLIALQVGAAALLLIASTVFLRSAFTATRIDLGLRTSDTLLMPVTHEPFRATILDQVGSHPSVVGVAGSWPGLNGSPALARAQTASSTIAIGYDFVSPEYFSVLGIDILKGRDFAQGERTADAGVAVLSAQGARRLFPAGQALGQTVEFEANPPSNPQRPGALRSPARPYTVIGVVRDIGANLGGGVTFLMNPDVYLPITLDTPGMSLALRVNGDPDNARRVLLDRFVALDPAFGGITTLRTMTKGRAFVLWIAFWVTIVLAGLALTLTASGLFSVLSYVVEERKKEIGVRMALGATTRNIARWVISQTIGPTALGVVAGAGLVTVLVRVLVSWVPFWLGGTVGVLDPAMYGVSLTVIVVTCAIAAAVPAWRAARVDPIETLRQD
jgi:predicted permease